MKQLLLLIVIVHLSLNFYGQSSTVTYYNQYGTQTGTATIKPDINPYTPNYVPQLPAYQSTVPLDLMMQVGQQKQALYDKRKVWIQDEIDFIGSTINNYLMKKYPKQGKIIYNRYSTIINDINSRSNDLSLSSVFEPIATNLKKIEREVYDAYNRLETESATLKRNIDNVINTYNSYASYPIIKDGWHKVYCTNGYSELFYTECLVTDGVIKEIRTCEDYEKNPNLGIGQDEEIYGFINSPYIHSCKAIIQLTQRYYYTVYFMDDLNKYDSRNNVSNADAKTDNQTTVVADIQSKIKDKKYGEAISMIDDVIQKTPDNGEYISWRGTIYLFGLRNYEKAIQDFTSYIQMKPNESKQYYYRGEAYKHLDKNIEAVKDFSSCLKNDNEYVDAYFERALCKTNLSDRKGAVLDYDEIISRENNNSNHKSFLIATVYNNKGYCLFELGKYNEALILLNKAIDLGPTEAYIWSSRGELYFKQGKYKEAIIDMDKSIQLYDEKKSIASGGDNSIAYYVRGISKIKLGKKNSGCTDLSKAGELGSSEAYKAIKEKCH